MTKALLVIDLQNDYFPSGKFPLWNTDAVLENIERAIANARTNIPIVKKPLVSLNSDSLFIAKKRSILLTVGQNRELLTSF